jgi:hypothetical protein
MMRGIERTRIFRDDRDRSDFIARLGDLTLRGALTIYAWALLPNHAHLRVWPGAHPSPRSMRSLLTGYAGAFKRRYRRVGHLFQSRYKSIVVEEEPYLLELVRCLHLNLRRASPGRAKGSLTCGVVSHASPAARRPRARRVPSDGRGGDPGRAHGRVVGWRVAKIAVIANV